MKKRRKALLLLAFLMCLMLPGIRSQASNAVTVAKGTGSAQVTLTVSKMQSFEGEFTCSSGLQIDSATVECVPGAMCQATSSRVFMAGSGDPVKTTITLKLSITDSQKDAVYSVKLTGSGTDAAGIYPKKVSAKATVTVGNPSETKEKEEEKEEEKKEETVKETITSEKDAGKTESTESAEETANENAVNAEEAEEEMSSVEDLSAEAAETENTSSRKGFSFPWWLIVLLVLLILLAAAAGYYFWKKRHPKEAAYEGAPMVEYDIEDDDMDE